MAEIRSTLHDPGVSWWRAGGIEAARLDVPGGINGTIPTGINSSGVITGYFSETNSAAHGFPRMP